MPRPPLFSLANGICNVILVVLNIVIVLIASSFLTYTISKWLLSHNIHFHSPLNLVFNPCSDGSVCSFPMANVSLPGSFFSHDLGYRIGVSVDVPDSDNNRQVGVVQLIARLFDKHSHVNKILPKSVVLPHKSWYVRLVRTFFFFPLYLFGLSSECLSVFVTFDEQFIDDHFAQTTRIQIELQHTKIIVTNAVLRIDAKLGFVRSVLYTFPLLTSFTVFVMSLGLSLGLSAVYWTGKSAAALITALENFEKEKRDKTPARLYTPNKRILSRNVSSSKMNTPGLPNLSSPIVRRNSVADILNPLNDL